MKTVIPLDQAIVKATLNSSPLEASLLDKEWFVKVASMTGLSPEEVKELFDSGEIDNYLSQGFYTLSLIALRASIEAIESGEVPPEKIHEVAMKAGELAQRLSGRDIKKHLVLSADLWQREAEKAVEETIDVEGCEHGSL